MRRSRIAAIAIVLKTITSQGVRGFESHLLRHSYSHHTCPHSSTDRMRACGVRDVGSIPTGGTLHFVQCKLIQSSKKLCKIYCKVFFDKTEKLTGCGKLKF